MVLSNNLYDIHRAAVITIIASKLCCRRDRKLTATTLYTAGININNMLLSINTCPTFLISARYPPAVVAEPVPNTFCIASNKLQVNMTSVSQYCRSVLCVSFCYIL